MSASPGPALDIQGHRGARGLRPENTIPAFDLALELGVDTLELDVVISGDSLVVVSHDPVMSREICSGPDGGPVAETVCLFDLTYQEIAAFDCGSRGNPRFPEQVAMEVAKPLLSDVIRFEDRRSGELGRPPARWNIETKSTREGDGTMHPTPEDFVRLLHRVLRDEGILQRTTVQSFDVRTLQAMRALDPSVTLSLLVELTKVGRVEENVEFLGFVPEVYSPNHAALTEDLVRKVHQLGMKVVPWTINDVDRMAALVQMGVDGLITDYPDRAMKLFRHR